MSHDVRDVAVECGGITTPLAIAPTLAPALRARRVRQAPATAALIAARGRTLRLQASRPRTGPGAIALAAIAPAAKHHLRTATRTHEQAGGMVDQLPGSSGTVPRRPPASMQCRSAQTHTLQLHLALAWCRARRAVLSCQAAGRRPARLPSRARLRFYLIRAAPLLGTHAAALQAALQGGLQDLFDRGAPQDEKTSLHHRRRNRHLTALKKKSPSHRRISALPDRR